jgi:hypothetical protein
VLWWPKLGIPSSKGRTEWNTSTLDHGLRFIAGPEPEMETLNNMVHPPSPDTGRPG